MRELAIETALRLGKVLIAALLGLLAWAVATGPFGATGSPELALLCFLVGASLVLLVESGPF